jgi:hypothetical protein
MFSLTLVPVFLALASLAAGGPIPIRRSSHELHARETVTDFSGGTGDATFYETGLGACGVTNTDTDFIAAIGEDFFDQYPASAGDSSYSADPNPNTNPICNRAVIATYQGKSVTVTITDRCAGCTIPYSLDLSPAAFQVLAPLSVGRLHGMTWVWANSGSTSAPSAGSNDEPTNVTSAISYQTAVPVVTPVARSNSNSTSSATSSSSQTSGFVSLTVSSSATPTASPIRVQQIKQSNGASRSIRRIWQF